MASATIDAYKKYLSHCVSLVGSRNDVEETATEIGGAMAMIEAGVPPAPREIASSHFGQNCRWRPRPSRTSNRTWFFLQAANVALTPRACVSVLVKLKNVPFDLQ